MIVQHSNIHTSIHSNMLQFKWGLLTISNIQSISEHFSRQYQTLAYAWVPYSTIQNNFLSVLSPEPFLASLATFSQHVQLLRDHYFLFVFLRLILLLPVSHYDHLDESYLLPSLLSPKQLCLRLQLCG